MLHIYPAWVCWTSWIYKFVSFVKFGKFSHYFFLIFFWDSNYMLDHLTLFYRFLRLYSCFSIYSLNWLHFIDPSWDYSFFCYLHFPIKPNWWLFNFRYYILFKISIWSFFCNFYFSSETFIHQSIFSLASLIITIENPCSPIPTSGSSWDLSLLIVISVE